MPEFEPTRLRIGTATDIHAFSTNPARPMMLACLEWPGVVGLDGHSDADVVAHAVCDALLIAAGVGEMGSVFGTSRPEFAGASGETFLSETVRLVSEVGFQVVNVSVQVIGSKPRFSPRKREAEERMSQLLGSPCSVSATTSDGLGFPGRDEGLAAIATALLYYTEDASAHAEPSA